jgi:transcriptional regulator with XRE-family HTH domain
MRGLICMACASTRRMMSCAPLSGGRIAAGHRTVLVITGKGSRHARSAPDAPPWAVGSGILRQAVPGWLAAPDLRAAVLVLSQPMQAMAGRARFMCAAREEPNGGPGFESAMTSTTLTPLGEKLRRCALSAASPRPQMAEALNVSSAYLSALEHGKRGLPNWAFVQRLVGYFNLIWDDADELETLALLSDPRVVVDTSDLSPTRRGLPMCLRSVISHLSAAATASILKTSSRC